MQFKMVIGKMWTFEINRESAHGKIKHILEMIGGNEVLFPLNLTYSLKMST